MQPPRWFWVFVAACVLAVSVAGAWHLRYKVLSADRYLDVWTGNICLTDTGNCYGHG